LLMGERRNWGGRRSLTRSARFGGTGGAGGRKRAFGPGLPWSKRGYADRLFLGKIAPPCFAYGRRVGPLAYCWGARKSPPPRHQRPGLLGDGRWLAGGPNPAGVRNSVRDRGGPGIETRSVPIRGLRGRRGGGEGEGNLEWPPPAPGAPSRKKQRAPPGRIEHNMLTGGAAGVECCRGPLQVRCERLPQGGPPLGADRRSNRNGCTLCLACVSPARRAPCPDDFPSVRFCSGCAGGWPWVPCGLWPVAQAACPEKTSIYFTSSRRSLFERPRTAGARVLKGEGHFFA